MIFLAAENPATKPAINVCGGASPFCNLDYYSLISSAIAILITIVFWLWLARRLSSTQPGKLQAVVELIYGYARTQLKEQTGDEHSFILPIALTLFFYILVANWIDFFPLGVVRTFRPANSDLNQTVAMALLVIIVVQGYSLRVLGLKGYLRRFTKPFELPRFVRYTYFLFLNILEEVTKPISLALRLWGNIWAGGVLMIFLIGLLAGAGGIWAGVGLIFTLIWKPFDVFLIGSIQAFIFMLLTIIYFGMAREGLEEHH